MNSIGNIIKEERKKKRLTLKNLSIITNIPISSISNIENEKIKNPSDVYLYKLCNALNLNYTDLLIKKWNKNFNYFESRRKY